MLISFFSVWAINESTLTKWLIIFQKDERDKQKCGMSRIFTYKIKTWFATTGGRSTNRAFQTEGIDSVCVCVCVWEREREREGERERERERETEWVSVCLHLHFHLHHLFQTLMTAKNSFDLKPHISQIAYTYKPFDIRFIKTVLMCVSEVIAPVRRCMFAHNSATVSRHR